MQQAKCNRLTAINNPLNSRQQITARPLGADKAMSKREHSLYTSKQSPYTTDSATVSLRIS